jgi:uncharacterized protein
MALTALEADPRTGDRRRVKDPLRGHHRQNPAEIGSKSGTLSPEVTSMLIRFQFSNFRSFKSEQELSLVASPSGGEQAGEHVLDLLRVAAVYGANAAGKSNVLSALQFMSSAVRDSHRAWKPDGPIPRQPFALDNESRVAPSRFEIDLFINAVRHNYGFAVDDKQILREWLYVYPSGRKQRWFYRDAGADVAFSFGKNLRGNNRTISSLARENSLFLSVAAENNHPLLSPLYSWLVNSLKFASPDNQPIRLGLTLGKFKDNGDAIIEYVKMADLGISGFALKNQEVDTKTVDLLKHFVEYAGATLDIPSGLQVTTPEFEHLSSTAEGPVVLPVEQESRGTRVWLSLLGPLFETLNSGGVLCVDELDASLHSRLALEVLRLFEDPQRNPNKAQLIFNTHDTALLGNLLGERGLRRDQIWFVEKEAGGATHLYPMTDFKPRKEENLERGYLQGRYGAVPFVLPAPSAGADDG